MAEKEPKCETKIIRTIKDGCVCIISVERRPDTPPIDKWNITTLLKRCAGFKKTNTKNKLFNKIAERKSFGYFLPLKNTFYLNNKKILFVVPCFHQRIFPLSIFQNCAKYQHCYNSIFAKTYEKIRRQHATLQCLLSFH